MKPVHKHLVVAACVALLGLSAGAQPAQPAIVAPATAAPGPGQHPMMQGHMAHMQQRAAQREAALKQILQIAPAQEGAWNTWIASRRPSANMPRPQRGEFAQLSTPERIDRMRSLRAARIAEMDRRADATKTFYAALTPAQQKSFDALTASRGWGGHRMGGGEGRHGGWGHHMG
jgi:periplasmic protein CpxP/Spy